MQLSSPTLIIVSGAPGSGKTTLAHRLASDLRLPLISKDELKETLADATGVPPDAAASMQLGLAAYAVLYFVAQQLLEAPGGVIIESNFRRGASEPELRPIATLVVDTADGWRPSYEEVREFAGAPHTGSPR